MSTMNCPHCPRTVDVPEGFMQWAGHCECGRSVFDTVTDLHDEHQGTHTPTDSLIVISRMVNHLLDVALEELHGVHTETGMDTEDLPEHMQDAVASIEHAARIIQHEAFMHGASHRRFYDSGQRTSEVREEPRLEPRESGIAALVFTDLHFDLYPDGEAFHPIGRPHKETA